MKFLDLFVLVSSIVTTLLWCCLTGSILKDFYYYIKGKLNGKWCNYFIAIISFYILLNIWIWSIVLFIILITNGGVL
jgi:hypothetical protein